MDKIETKKMIQEQLTKKNVLQKELAKEMGITKFALSKIISNKQKMYLSEFVTLSKYLGISFDDRLFSVESISTDALQEYFLNVADKDEKEELLHKLCSEYNFDPPHYFYIEDMISILEYTNDVLHITSYNDYKELLERCVEYNLIVTDSDDIETDTKKTYFDNAREYLEYIDLKKHLEEYENQYRFDMDSITPK